MNSWKKHKLKEYIKKKKVWFIGTGIFLIVGVVLLLVGFRMSGWSLIVWLQSPYAVTCFVCVGISLLILFWAGFNSFRDKMGGGDDTK